jgi:hypothetical protein
MLLLVLMMDGIIQADRGVMMLEELIASLLEKSLIGGCFIYLLYYVVQNMKSITDSLGCVGETLKEVSGTLLKIDLRVEMLEKRMNTLEDKGV